MYYRCELLVGGYTYDVTNDLVNWDDVELNYKRGDYDGVVRSFSTKFEFCNAAYSLLVGEYHTNYLNASASIVYYKRNNSWLWNEFFRCSLDFSTLTYDGLTCNINAVDDSLASIIKAKKGTQYEYVVSEVKESAPLRYDRISMQNQIKWTIPLNTEEGSYEFVTSQNRVYVIPTYIESSEVSNEAGVEFYDSQEAEYASNEASNDNIGWAFINNSGASLNVRMRLKCKMIYNQPYEQGVSSVVFGFLKQHNQTFTHASTGVAVTMRNNGIYTINIDSSVEVEDGTKIFLALSALHVTKTMTQTIYDIEVPPTFEFVSIGRPVKIDVVKPTTLLNRLLKSMNGGKEGITGTIASGVDERLDMALIVPAESVRGLDGAKLYSSYSKFCEWMSAEFGFVPVVGENIVQFVHRNSLFTNAAVKDLGDDCTGFDFSVESSLIYSRVRVGYEKQDYESVNGRDEWRFTNEYSTGITFADNSLELISPYRADAYGIEFLAAKRGEDTTDNESDNTVFFVGATYKSGDDPYYELVRHSGTSYQQYKVENIVSPTTMFNVMYSQRFMISANKEWIGVSCSTLEYASADGNSEVIIAGTNEKQDIDIDSRLFTVGELSVETGDVSIPEDLSGYMTVGKNGNTYKGYLKSVGYNLGREESVKYTLIVKEVE